ncbi:MAG: DinB family protein [Terracidiphilus sp.]
MKEQTLLRQHVVNLLKGGEAHADFDAATANLPANLRGERPKGADHSPWELVEHLRIAQWDILEYSRDPKHKSPEFPAGYWPKSPAPPSEEAWEQSLKAFRKDLEALSDLVSSESTDLLAPIPHAKDHTILREALLAADHNAYHIGQLVLVRRLLGAWK